ncbi:MAG TPA: hypothetical protein VMZ52_01970 [Bryobacteraceae bacterium]|nr:hypothetical protein [Bryobacteraceae bacterium]
MGILAIFVLAALSAGAGTPPKKSAAEYPVHQDSDKAAIGAEFWIHSFAAEGQTFLTSDYLVVEVALFPAGGQELMVSASQFHIQINGRDTRLAQAPSFVAASMKYSDWEQRPHMTGQSGPIILGRQAPGERFPGDRRPQEGRLPGQVPADAPEKRVLSAPELAVAAALPEGSTSYPVSGYLYFAYKGKLKSVKTLDLVYQTPSSAMTLKLR